MWRRRRPAHEREQRIAQLRDEYLRAVWSHRDPLAEQLAAEVDELVSSPAAAGRAQ